MPIFEHVFSLTTSVYVTASMTRSNYFWNCKTKILCCTIIRSCSLLDSKISICIVCELQYFTPAYYFILIARLCASINLLCAMLVDAKYEGVCDQIFID